MSALSDARNPKLNVLLIEDSPEHACVIHKLLAKAGTTSFNLECTDHLSTGLRRLAAGGIDLVVLDLMLPDSGGLDTFVRTHNQALGVPIVVLTTLEDEPMALAAVQKGAQDYLVKGQVNADLLLRAVRYANERKGTERALEETQETYKAVVESVADAIVINVGTRRVFANRAFLTLHGLNDMAEALGSSLEAYIVPEDQALVRERTLARQQGQPVPGVYEYRIRRPDGEVRTVQTSAVAITYNRESAALAVLRDVTDRKRAEEALQEARQYLTRLIESSTDAIIATNDEGNVVLFNRGAEIMLGYPRGEVMGQRVTAVYQSEDQAKEVMRRMRQHGGTVAGFETILRAKDGTPIPVLISASILYDADGQEVGTVGFNKDLRERKGVEEALRRARDELERGVQERTAELSKTIDVLEEQIAERHRAEEQLRKSEEQLRALSLRLLAIQEDERTQIAREVHDELGQALTALKIDLAWLGQRMPGKQKKFQAKLQTMTHLVDETVQAVRRIATELRPGVLDHLGLVPALDWQVQEFQDRTGIACVFTKPAMDLVMDPAQATTVFRICQEALTNVARHASATRVDLHVDRVGQTLVVEVRDNGKGISAEAPSNPNSLGLIGMRERVLPWGGSLSINGSPGAGTTVTVHLPLDTRDAGCAGGRP